MRLMAAMPFAELLVLLHRVFGCVAGQNRRVWQHWMEHNLCRLQWRPSLLCRKYGRWRLHGCGFNQLVWIGRTDFLLTKFESTPTPSPTSTPTPTPTATSTPTSTPTPTATPTPTPQPVAPVDYTWYIIIGVVAVIALLLVFVVLKRRKPRTQSSP